MLERHVYGPNRTFAMVAVSVFIGTAFALAWLGTALGPKDLGAMDGFQKLLFTVVPIRPFSWVFSAVFGFFGVRLGLRGWRARPSLIISTQGFSVGTGALQPWSQLSVVKNPGPTFWSSKCTQRGSADWARRP